MTMLYIGSKKYGERRWSDFWWQEESVLDHINRPMVVTCKCGGINGNHIPCCEVSVNEAVATAIRFNWKSSNIEAWADGHDEAGFKDLGNHWRMVAKQVRKREEARNEDVKSTSDG